MKDKKSHSVYHKYQVNECNLQILLWSMNVSQFIFLIYFRSFVYDKFPVLY